MIFYMVGHMQSFNILALKLWICIGNKHTGTDNFGGSMFIFSDLGDLTEEFDIHSRNLCLFLKTICISRLVFVEVQC